MKRSFIYRLSMRWLRWFCNPSLLEDVEGDLEELYDQNAEINRTKASWLLARDVLLLFRPGIIKQLSITQNSNTTAMFKNYMVTALRNASRYRSHTTINVSGLVIGLVSSLFIFLWIKDETSVDKFHEKGDRLYRVWRNMVQANGEIHTTPGIPQPLHAVLATEYPEIDQVALLGWEMSLLLKSGENVFHETGRYVSEDFLTIMSFPLLKGNAATALNDINSIAITENIAVKYFGSDWEQQGIIGEVIQVDNNKDFMVSAVLENAPSNSSLQFDWLLPAQEYVNRNEWVTSWYNGGFSMLFTLRDGVPLAQINERLEGEVNRHIDNDADEPLFVQKYSDHYLNAIFENGRPAGGRSQYVTILGVVAVFILVIACVNFMNLAMARSFKRSREIGMRKAMGAHKSAISTQFFFESFLFVAFSMLVAIGLSYLLLPVFNRVSGKEIDINFINLSFLVYTAIVTLSVGFLAGAYPALMMGSYKITAALKGVIRQGVLSKNVQKSLVTFQFIISILMIIGTLTVHKQMTYIFNKNIGLDRENVIYMELEGSMREQFDVFKNELSQHSEILSVTNASGNPLNYGRSTSGASWEGKNPDDVVEINVLTVGDDFIETMQMNIMAGRDFSDEFGADSAHFIVNEVLTKTMGYADPIGKSVTLWGTKGKIIGVVNDFHMRSMYEPIAPVIIRHDPFNANMSFIKYAGDAQQAVQLLKSTSAKINPDLPMAHRFMDQEFNHTYESEVTLSDMVKWFAFISILISCLGLFGLSSFTLHQKSKEIGIRKVHGATKWELVFVLSREYALLVGLAFLLAAPIGYYFLGNWLNDFEFRTDLNILLFVGAGLVALCISIVTVGYKSWQAARSNPSETLKME
ncbi:MAG: ABC transporter permease [Cyclobacteriaceae bacterium]